MSEVSKVVSCDSTSAVIIANESDIPIDDGVFEGIVDWAEQSKVLKRELVSTTECQGVEWE